MTCQYPLLSAVGVIVLPALQCCYCRHFQPLTPVAVSTYPLRPTGWRGVGSRHAFYVWQHSCRHAHVHHMHTVLPRLQQHFVLLGPNSLLACRTAALLTLAPQDGVVLAADTRSTSGSTVADKNCEKIHYIAPNIYCCGAGTAADTENVTGGVGVGWRGGIGFLSNCQCAVGIFWGCASAVCVTLSRPEHVQAPAAAGHLCRSLLASCTSTN